MKRAVIYIRVSTEEQTQGMSLTVQEESCRKFCADSDIQVAHVFTDAGASAKTADRPGFQEMMQYCTKHREHLTHAIVYKLDRFSRSTEDAAIYGGILAKADIHLLSATEPMSNDASGKLLKNILSALAEFDNSVKGERSQASMTKLVEEGFWVHKGPLGYINTRDENNRPILEEDPKNGVLVRQLFEAIAKQGLTKSGAAEYADRMGLKQRNGKPITKQYLNKILHNPLYCGRICCKQTKGQVVQAAFPALIPEALFDQVQITLKGRGKVPTPHHRNNEVFPLRRIVCCGHCEKPLTGSFSRSKNGRQYPYYFCQQKACRKVSVRKEAMEAEFVCQLKDITIQTSSTLGMFREIVTQVWKHMQGDAVIEQAGFTNQIDRLGQRKDLLLEKLLDSTITDAIYRQKCLEVDTDISLLQAQLHDAEVDELEVGNMLDRAEHLLKNAAALWKQLEGDLDNRQRLVRVLYPDGLSYSKEDGYRTPVKSPVAMICEVVSGREKEMAPPRGLEPLLPE